MQQAQTFHGTETSPSQGCKVPRRHWAHPNPLEALMLWSHSAGDGEVGDELVLQRASRRRMTEPLVALLHHRKELREIYAPADVIDQAIRDGV